MGVPPVQTGRAGRPSHKKYQIVSYLILIPYLSGNSIPKFPAAGTWQEWMYNKIVEVGAEGFKFDLPEWSA